MKRRHARFIPDRPYTITARRRELIRRRFLESAAAASLHLDSAFLDSYAKRYRHVCEMAKAGTLRTVETIVSGCPQKGDSR